MTAHFSASQPKKSMLPTMAPNLKTSVAAPNNNNDDHHHVVIVGAGMSGLMAAQELLFESDRIKVTVVEASSEVGGRCKALTDFVENHVIDLGAEFVHGQGTALTDLIEKYQHRWKDLLKDDEPLFEEIFITSYADGGPSPLPTPDGKYGMYYCGGELMNYDDERLHPLEKALGTMDEYEAITDRTTLSDVLGDLPTPALQSMAIAGYGNTAGCTNHDDISLKMLLAFEDYWQENEEAGDVRLNSRIGMAGIANELLADLKQQTRFTLKLNWKVAKVEATIGGGAQVMSEAGECIVGDSVVISTPPTLWSRIVELPPEKADAVSFIGEEEAIKVMLKFQTRVWPRHLQSLVCADCPAPELWFRDFDSCSLAVCFMTSQAARDFYLECGEDESKITALVLNQMSQVLSLPLAELQEAHLETRMKVWEVGYMFPKVGLQSHHLEELAKPHGAIYFAGEATHTGACCTVQAAMETGVRAARRICATLEM